MIESSLVVASFLQAERIQIVAVAVGKTFGVAVRAPVLVAEEIFDLFVAVQMAVDYFQCLSEAVTVVAAPAAFV